MGHLFNVLTIELRIRGPKPKSMLGQSAIAANTLSRHAFLTSGSKRSG
ncbi:hypothetical protein [Mesorhizobium sp.]|nr:hypothetical protein [Mesorhizobium sp.]